MAGLTVDLTPITTQEFGAKAPRPAYSVLANDALTRAGLDLMPHWTRGLADYLAGTPKFGSGGL